ncbi:hypothetical protein DL769_007950 [Monosporascus sp. CRB-8-3]|nr:hypothetical protein DL769_007950 [Monosporascus sp. CRB-8-3]
MADNNMDAAREGRLGEEGEKWQLTTMRHLAAGDKAAQLFFSSAVFWASAFMLSASGPSPRKPPPAATIRPRSSSAPLAMLLGASTVPLAALALFEGCSVRVRGLLCAELVSVAAWGAWSLYLLLERTVVSGARFGPVGPSALATTCLAVLLRRVVLPSRRGGDRVDRTVDWISRKLARRDGAVQARRGVRSLTGC